MSDEHDSEIEFPTIPYEDRLQLAHKIWKQGNGAISIAKAANIHGVSKSTLRDRINGAIPKAEASQNMQRLSPGEEEALASWMLLLASWGWPVRVEQLRGMACELLQAKGDTKELGIHWTEQFLKRHLILKSKFITGLEKDRVAAEDPDIIKAWFELVDYHVTKNAVEKEDIHNMDEKGVMMGASEKVKVIISKNEKRQYMTASDSREWVSLIECISVIGKAQDPWIIFKGKMHKASWMQTLQSGHIALSETGWTDNELGLAWLKNCFDPGTL